MKRNDYIDETENYLEDDLKISDGYDTEEAADQPTPKQSQRKRKEDQEEKKQREALNAIRRYTDDEEQEDDSEHFSIKSVIGGDILKSKFFVKQVVFIMFCVFLMVLYTANRYASQQEIIKIDKLNEQILDSKNQRLLQESQLINLKRQSQIEAQLMEMGDTAMLQHTMPPFALPSE